MQFIRNPRMVGAVCPSSERLCRTLTDSIGLENAASVAELGPGTGVVTNQILRRKSPNAAFFAVELNGAVIDTLQKRFPNLTIYHDSAANLPNLLDKSHLKSLDVIISGLPWAAFPEQLQNDLLHAIIDGLAPDGRFVTFAYLQGIMLPAGISFRRKLRRFFSSVETSPVVWRNIPPAFVYRCRK